MRKKLLAVVILLIVLGLLAAQCAPPAAPPPPAETGGKAEYKFAAIFPGVITDADYNTLGFIGATAVQSDLGLEMAYSESVAVPDVERVMREYIDNGFNIIFTHGGQFISQTIDLANEFPDVYFIGEGDAPVENPPPNFWIIDRNFQIGFYPIGVLAGLQSKTGKIAYIGGLTLPFSYAEVHAMQQAVEEQNLNVEIKPVWVGDFNDPTKARELTQAMLSEGVDVIVGSLNLGMFGLFEAVKGAGGDVYATAKYVDKTNYAPDNYLTAVIYDWATPLKDISQKIMDGETGGYYPMEFGTGFNLQMPILNTTDEINQAVEQIVADIQAGKIEVVKNTEPIE